MHGFILLRLLRAANAGIYHRTLFPIQLSCRTSHDCPQFFFS